MDVLVMGESHYGLVTGRHNASVAFLFRFSNMRFRGPHEGESIIPFSQID